jgi:hypothetical protein
VTADGLTVDGTVSVVSALPRIILEENDATDLNTAIRNNGGVFKVQTVNDAANSFTNRMDINHSSGDIILHGNVGIGASSPQKNLEIKDATLPVLRLNCGRNETSGSDYALGDIEFFSSDTSGTGSRVLTSINAIADASSTAPGGYLTFKTSPTNSAAVERMRVDSSGNLLVGKTSANFNSSGRGNVEIGGTGRAICA